MTMKREHSVFFGRTLYFLRGWLFVVFFGICFLGSAQTFRITTGNNPDPDRGNGDPNAAETGNPSPANRGRFAVIRTPNAFSNATVNYEVTGTAIEGVDYEALSGTVSFVPGQRSAFINVDALDDNFVENNETVTVTLTSATNGGIDSTPATVTISDVTDVGVISLDTTEPPFIPEASEEGPTNGRFRIVLDHPNGTATPVTVNYTLSGTATNGSDYTISGAVTMTFNNNANNPQLARNLNIIPDRG